ncbi:restriction endonuclease subunit S [Paracoccus marinaquae]|uniref:Restriction endonuclease subunit S n=1 Tax=Paracoccus marinaquae TaxID=2841926 RepID=A0ABS6AQN3_9RHOB|nr:restriction endonuclease subunit S [Paracoccus marinaquae]
MTLVRKRLHQLGRVVTGKTPPTARQELFQGEYLFITPSDLDYNHYYCRSAERTVSEQAKATLRNQFIPANAVMFTCIGATIGKCGIAPSECLTNQQINSVIANDECDPRFLYYLLCNSVDIVKGMGGGAATPIVNKSKFENIDFLVPPLRQQQEVGRILSAYDDMIENNRRRIVLLEEAARLLYREWFVHFRFPGHEHVPLTDGLPNGWERQIFDDVCETIGGGTPKTEKPEFWNDGDIPWYTPTDITRNSCLALLDSATKITEAGLRGSSAKMLPAGTVLMTSRASVGFFGIIETPSCTNQGFVSIIPHDPRARMYLLHNLMHRVEEIRSHAGGATYKEISKGKFRALPVIIPDAALLREFEDQASTLHSQVRTLHTQNQKLAQARDLLLPRLMNGEIAV